MQALTPNKLVAAVVLAIAAIGAPTSALAQAEGPPPSPSGPLVPATPPRR